MGRYRTCAATALGAKIDSMQDKDLDNLQQEYERLDTVLGALDAAIQEREDARTRAIATARAVGAQLARLGHFARIAEQPFDNAVARRIYWEYPDVHVAELAHPMGLLEGTVSREVGTGTFEKDCRGGCGRTVTWRMRSRSDSARHSQPRFCDECKAKRDADYAQWRAQQDAEHAANLDLLQSAVDGESLPSMRYAEFRGVPGTWAVDENGVPLALLRSE